MVVFFNRKKVNVCEHTTKMASHVMSCVHKHLLSSYWEFRPCQSKYLDTVSVCLCVPVLRWSLQFLVRVFTFLSLNLSFTAVILILMMNRCIKTAVSLGMQWLNWLIRKYGMNTKSLMIVPLGQRELQWTWYFFFKIINRKKLGIWQRYVHSIYQLWNSFNSYYR